eukprot:CAMPEP_0197825328 /NCGR_PEP_ID=MMETSP1437-20131217/2429_1 /TAXON_ID=49252 ORGANISM="Eucampia antarctica, Strain CCMP1452" /NCGR_SAMPLE_ID=MMETSP1437 /ASSEMBLY_ACC=CAM_ASM_001096 /LENGTH=281 /DNA_ID=CAMNT_0043425281 /DNA_START=126 /DNA_END=971 /DNA_ORIENTATION=-
MVLIRNVPTVFALGSMMMTMMMMMIGCAIIPTNGFNIENNNHNNHNKCNNNNNNNDHDHVNRRRMFQSIASTCSILTTSLLANTSPVLAKDEIYKSNPLTNSVLNQIRIWEQDEKDNLVYGGELAPGAPPVKDAYAQLLVPILQMAQDFDRMEDLLVSGKWLEAKESILDKSCYEKIAFKKIFNAFADNIYYTDPDRANVYLGGGASPKAVQSIAYLYRNEILTNLEALQAEVTYLLKEESKGEDTKDLFTYMSKAKQTMLKYLELVPPAEMKAATKLITQ